MSAKVKEFYRIVENIFLEEYLEDENLSIEYYEKKKIGFKELIHCIDFKIKLNRYFEMRINKNEYHIKIPDFQIEKVIEITQIVDNV